MSRKIRILLFLVGGLLALLVVVLLGLYLGSQHVPAFYREALEADPIEQEQASDRMLQQSMALASALKKAGRWEAVFTAEEINGWLAVDMVKNHPGAVAPPLSDPRVAIDANAMTVACTIEQAGRSSVISLSVEPFMSEPNVLALRIVKARAGMLPLPLGEILDRISQAAHRRNCTSNGGSRAGIPLPC